MCSGKERKTALSIFGSIKILFPRLMKTICLYNVAAAWGYVQKSHTETPIGAEKWKPYQVGELNGVLLIWKAEAGRGRESKRKYISHNA